MISESTHVAPISRQAVRAPGGIEERRLNPGEDLTEVIARAKCDLVLIQDRHLERFIRQRLVEPGLAERLREAGVTHYVAEAPAIDTTLDLFERLNRGQRVDFSMESFFGPLQGRDDENFGVVLTRMAKAGIQVVPGDHPGNSGTIPGRITTESEREKWITEKWLSLLAQGAFPLGLYGRLHTVDGVVPPDVASMAQQLATAGKRVLSLALPPQDSESSSGRQHASWSDS